MNFCIANDGSIVSYLIAVLFKLFRSTQLRTQSQALKLSERIKKAAPPWNCATILKYKIAVDVIIISERLS